MHGALTRPEPMADAAPPLAVALQAHKDGLTKGKRPDGSLLASPMPWRYLATMRDEDIDAIPAGCGLFDNGGASVVALDRSEAELKEVRGVVGGMLPHRRQRIRRLDKPSGRSHEKVLIAGQINIHGGHSSPGAGRIAATKADSPGMPLF